MKNIDFLNMNDLEGVNTKIIELVIEEMKSKTLESQKSSAKALKKLIERNFLNGNMLKDILNISEKIIPAKDSGFIDNLKN